MNEALYGRIPSSDKPISRIVQGTAAFTLAAKAENIALLDAIFEMGCTAIDTAHSYSGGYSERFIGEWMQTRDNREAVFILSKGCHPSDDRKRVTPFDLTADLHDSLARLRTDYIDLYLMHRDDTAVPVGVLVDTMNAHLQAGKIRAYGGSNWTIARIQEANAYAAANGLVGFAASSPQFSLGVPTKPPWPDCETVSGAAEASGRAWYAQQQIPLFPWSSLAAGFFSGRFNRQSQGPYDFWLDNICYESYFSDDNFDRLDRANQMAAEKGLTLPQLALAYVLNQPQPIFALVGQRSPEEFAINLEAVACRLSVAELQWLENGKL